MAFNETDVCGKTSFKKMSNFFIRFFYNINFD